MEQNENKLNIAQEIFNQFIWFYKKKFDWKWFTHNNVCKRNTFLGGIDMDKPE